MVAVKKASVKKAKKTGKRKLLNKFDAAVQRHKKNGTFKGSVDAKEDRWVTIVQAHIDVAKMKDETACVVSQALGDQLMGTNVVSTGHSIVKILNDDTGVITRYATGPKLAASLKKFDKRKGWDLGVGSFLLAKPSGTLALRKNQSKKLQEQSKKRFKEFEERLKTGETAGTGYGRHKSQPIDSRIITIVR